MVCYQHWWYAIVRVALRIAVPAPGGLLRGRSTCRPLKATKCLCYGRRLQVKLLTAEVVLPSPGVYFAAPVFFVSGAGLTVRDASSISDSFKSMGCDGTSP